jgi:3-oxoacid CoA-transferase subunit B
MKARLDEQTIALRVAKEFQDGWYVNLGFGIPTLVSNFIPEGRTVIFQAENGVLGYGRIATPDEADEQAWWIVNGGAQAIIAQPGMSLFDYAESMDMIRGGHLDAVVLGALEVSEKGDLANWMVPGKIGAIGGAMDLAVGAKKVYVAMEHVTKGGQPKIVKQCSYPLTAKACVNLIVSDLAVIEVAREGLILKEIAPGWTVNEIQELTEPKLIVAPELKEIEL